MTELRDVCRELIALYQRFYDTNNNPNVSRLYSADLNYNGWRDEDTDRLYQLVAMMKDILDGETDEPHSSTDGDFCCCSSVPNK